MSSSLNLDPSPIVAPLLDRTFGAALAGVTLVKHALGHVEGLVADVLRDSRSVVDESVALYTAAQAAAADVRATVRGTPRFTALVSTSVGVIARYRWYQVAKHGMRPQRAAERLTVIHHESAERIVEMCIELGGGALKLGQFLSTRMDLLPEPWVTALAKLQDRVPPEPWSEVEALLERELDAPVAEVFATFEQEPMAAASLAQVHAATLPDGRQVAVKVQRPGIAEVIEIDIAAMGVIAKVLREVMPQMDMASICAEVGASLRDELDFVDEAQHIETFTSLMGGRRYPLLPAPIRDFSTPLVLTLGRIDGSRIVPYLDACAADGVDGAARRDELLRQLVDCYCEQILVHRTMHADPHPGNFLVVDGDDGMPRLALLDFGAVARLEPRHANAYASLVGATLAGRADEVARLLIELGFEARDGDMDTLVTFCEIILQQFRQNTNLQDIDPHEQLALAIQLAKDNPVANVPRHFVMIGRVLASLGGLVMRYKPDLDLFQVVAPHLTAALRAAHLEKMAAPA